MPLETAVCKCRFSGCTLPSRNESVLVQTMQTGSDRDGRDADRPLPLLAHCEEAAAQIYDCHTGCVALVGREG